jgi:glycosyltransferase involved in cell wall biosynthesis
MHVVQVIDSLHIGGAERLLVTFAGQARLRGWQTAVVSLSERIDAGLVESIRSQEACVVFCAGRNLFAPGRFWRLVRFLRSARFDLVHTHLTYANILGVLAGKLAGLPAVATLHSTVRLTEYARPAVEALERASLRFLADRVVAVGDTVARVYRPLLGRKAITVIPNAVPEGVILDVEERLALRREIAGEPERTILISVGRFAPPKGFEDLVNAFAAVHAAQPDTTLAMVGDGPLLAGIQAQVQRLGLQGRVCLPGSRKDVPRWLAAADLYVSASRWEGLPLAILEAMIAGLPVVATAVGDVPQVIAPEAGRVVPPGRPEELAAAIGQLLADPPGLRAKGLAAQALARREHSTRIWMDRLCTLYESLPGAQLGSLAPPESHMVGKR